MLSMSCERIRLTLLITRSLRRSEDSIYLGCLYDAWKRAKAGQPQYSIEQVDIANDPDKPDGISPSTGKVWAVLKDGKIV